MKPTVGIESPPWAARPFGLFSAVTFVDEEQPRWRVGGAVFESPSCSGIGVRNDEWCATDTEPVLRPLVSGCQWIDDPVDWFTVYGAANGTPDDVRASRAVADLLRKEEQAAEYAMWTNLSNYSYPAKAVEANTTVFSDIREAVAELEAFGARTFGGAGVIHLTVRDGSLLGKDLIRQGQSLVTPIGNQVVVGSGYSGGPSRAFITPQLVGVRSTVSVVQTFNKERNDLDTYAERDYLIGYEECGAGYVTLAGDETPAPIYVQNGV